MIILLFTALMSFSLRAQYPCDADYDRLGIPHQKVSSEEEYYYCLGHHHAKDRAWQMDYFRRFAYGLNAEVLGYKHIKNDFMMRLLDLPALGLRLYQDFPNEYKKILESYANGVNAGFEIGKNADEFKKLKYTPAPWEPVHSLIVLLLQSFDQTKKTFFFDIKEQEKFEFFPQAAELFDENKTPWLTTILKEGEYTKIANNNTSDQLPKKTNLKMWASFPELFGENTGSNNWVISKSLSESGHAILANDPHLDLKTPAFWYWIHLKTPGKNIIGASLPGLPFIASGTNGDVSWGLTNSYLNSSDAIEITDLKGEDKKTHRPVIWFKFGFLKLPFFFKSIEKFNSIYPILPLTVSDIEPIVLRWSGYELKASDVTPMFDLHKQTNITDVDQLLSQVGVPSWNYVFADSHGDIGYRMVGLTYKNEKDPFGVGKMTKKEFFDTHFLNASERPHLIKPQREFLVTANNQHWPADSRFKGGRGYSLSFRAKRIEEMIMKKKRHNLLSIKEIQCDLFVTDASYFVPVLRSYLPDFLKSWDFVARDESQDLGIYRRLMDHLMDKWEVDESALYILLNDKNEFKKREKEIVSLYEKAKKEVAEREWKDLAYLPFEHLSGDDDFQYSPKLSARGDEHTVGPATTKWSKKDKKYHHYSGASMRMMVEMSRPVKVFLSLPGKNREYQLISDENPWNHWRDCQYFEVAL